ncbi:fasciclin domain-containing protein [Jannaschia rubra]|uniref:Immunogenic protein MPT70 n=1 Tax=Jannaschia rubra TaxID=282197 RepID=A0A0M6XN95_9RHOB|nr:fasciclin domain-containing protein [Jannaschia rubra]CTQ32650.1 Immunogenic protein MPT70 precursor [Jannaschia rubra]SFF86739.1 Uncaracterized surface protein containing fasciclin (FAS1) repeats [Jannaschia rubra]
MIDIINRRHLLAAGAIALAALSGCVTASDTGPDDIVETATEAGSFTTLLAAVEAADLVDTLKGPGPFTVFAPTDEAFAALPEGTVETLLLPENKDQLVSVLTYHVVPENYPASALAGTSGRLPTVNGAPLQVNGRGDGVTVEGVTVVTADVQASNGVIHVIDRVLLP